MGESEKTVVFVKPGNEDIARGVFVYLDESLRAPAPTLSYRRNRIKRVDNVPEEIITAHYPDLKVFGLEIARKTIEAYKNGTIFITTYEGWDIISRVRFSIGHTDPKRASDYSVRGHFRRDSLEKAMKQKRYLNNVIHASSNEDEARREIELWKAFL